MRIHPLILWFHFTHSFTYNIYIIILCQICGTRSREYSIHMYKSGIMRIIRNWTGNRGASSAVTPKRHDVCTTAHARLSAGRVIWSTPRAIARKGEAKQRRNKRSNERKENKRKKKKFRSVVGERGAGWAAGKNARAREHTCAWMHAESIFCGSLAESIVVLELAALGRSPSFGHEGDYTTYGRGEARTQGRSNGGGKGGRLGSRSTGAGNARGTRSASAWRDG